MVAVYRFPDSTRGAARSALICHLRDTTVDDAIAKLQRCGVLAIPGPVNDSIVLMGYHFETRELLNDYRVYGSPHSPQACFRLGWIRRLSRSA